MLTNPQPTIEDFGLDATLRPRKLSEYQGQNKVKENLKILIEAARQRKEPIEHVLLCGAAGLGKTTLAHIIASEMGVGIKVTSGPAIERVGDLGSILTNLSEGDVLFIDEAHRLNKLIEEVLYPAMEDFKLDIVIGKGPSARTLQLDLPHFTLIAATTRPSLLSSPLRSRFGITFRLDFYQLADIAKILNRSARILNIQADQEGTDQQCQGFPFASPVHCCCLSYLVKSPIFRTMPAPCRGSPRSSRGRSSVAGSTGRARPRRNP